MKKLFSIAAICAGFLVLSTSAYSNQLSIGLDWEFSGADSPASSNTPWVTLMFDDFNSTGLVRLTITNANLSGTEFVSGVYFNFMGDATALAMSHVSGDQASAISQNVASNNNKADGDGYFDVALSFPTQGNSRFGVGETVVYNILFTGIDVDDFNDISINGPLGKTGFYAAAHVQSIKLSTGGTTGSGWITGEPGTAVPEPATMLLFGAGLIGLAGVARRKVQ